MKKLMGACGLCCSECEIYRAYLSDDFEMKRAIAEKISKGFGRKVLPEQIICTGCKGEDELCWGEDCEIRMCVTVRGIDFCYQCKNYPCDKLRNFYDNGYKQAWANMEQMRTVEVHD